MKDYCVLDTEKVDFKIVSVRKEHRQDVAELLAALPYVDKAHPSKNYGTRIMVILSDLYEPSDLKDMEEVIRRAVADAD
jgi:hypothetical protein